MVQLAWYHYYFEGRWTVAKYYLVRPSVSMVLTNRSSLHVNALVGNKMGSE